MQNAGFKIFCLKITLNHQIRAIDKKNNYIKNSIYKFAAPVAQLDRALGYGPGGSGFKS